MKQPTPSPRSRKLKANRHMAVFVSLIATVALTVLLLALLEAPPLSDTAWRSLMAADGSPESLAEVFGTRVPVTPGRWRYVYVHHSHTAGGEATTLSPPGGQPGLSAPFADHFVIGNGQGLNDGEVQMTQAWNRQSAITLPPKGATVSAGCVSICLVGDFTNAPPTAAQQQALAALVSELQGQLNIPAKAVFAHPEVNTTAGLGRRFPLGSFRNHLLP